MNNRLRNSQQQRPQIFTHEDFIGRHRYRYAGHFPVRFESRLRERIQAHSAFGDMMIAGCFDLLAAGDVFPELRETIYAALTGGGKRGAAPWDN